MSQLKINRDYEISLIEEVWWEGVLDGKPVEIHGKVYRCNLGQWRGQFGVGLHLHSIGGGEMMAYGGAPKAEKLCWAGSRDEAVQKAIDVLEARQDLKVK